VLKFIERKWNLGALTLRDANADDLSDCLDFDNPPAFLEPPSLPAPALAAPSPPTCTPGSPGTIPPPGAVTPGHNATPPRAATRTEHREVRMGEPLAEAWATIAPRPPLPPR